MLQVAVEEMVMPQMVLYQLAEEVFFQTLG